MSEAEASTSAGQNDDVKPGNPAVEYLTLSPDSEPMRLESLCVNCERNVRSFSEPVDFGVLCSAAACEGNSLPRDLAWAAFASDTLRTLWRSRRHHNAMHDIMEPEADQNIITPAVIHPLLPNTLPVRRSRQGTTTFMMTRIPFFREVVLMAFECPHCNFRRVCKEASLALTLLHKDAMLCPRSLHQQALARVHSSGMSRSGDCP